MYKCKESCKESVEILEEFLAEADVFEWYCGMCGNEFESRKEHAMCPICYNPEPEQKLFSAKYEQKDRNEGMKEDERLGF
jgi:rubrerythrin